MSDAGLIDELGGTQAVADGMGETVHAVKKWRQRGVPLERRRDFQTFARKRGKELSDTWVWKPARDRAAARRSAA